MQLNELLSRLSGVKGHGGNQYTARCTVTNHGKGNGDKNPSLSVGVEGNRILLHCNAGCSPEAVVSALGLTLKDLFIEESPVSNKPKREIVAVYDYVDLNGNIIHSTIRYNPKGFSQRRPDPSCPGEYIYKDVFKDLKPIIYNLPAVTNAIKEKQPVLLVEGEKDCNSLAEYGFVATTCPMGAKKWHKAYSAMLTSGTVYIISDNDEIGNSHVNIVAKSLIGKAESIYLINLLSVMPDLPESGDISDFLEKTSQEERKAAVRGLIADAMLFVPDSPDSEESSQDETEDSYKAKKSQAELLLNLVDGTGAGFFHSDIKELYATLPVDGHTEILPIIGRDFEIWLNGLFYKNSGKPISKDAVKQVQGVLSAKALYDNPNPVKLSTRVAKHDGAFWYDLTNTNWQAVRITADGWDIIDNPPILFSRYRHQIQQSAPIKGGNIRKILDYVNIKENKTLFLCWLISCFVPNIPHTASIIHGEKGAAKSTASSLLKNLIDPSVLDTLTLENDQRTLAVNLQNHWFLPFDNVSYISEEVSNTLCRAITGGAIQQRKLHTNSEDAIFTFQRCIVINGIHNVATKADLLDRFIMIELMRISDTDRKELSEIMTNFESDKPDILGGIFDTLVKAMTIYPTVKLSNLPRMADFMRWGYAISEALGGLGQEFLHEYTGNRNIQNEEAIANHPVAKLIAELINSRPTGEWYGLYSDLYKKLEFMAEEFGISTKHKSFPANSIVLSKRITEIKSNLESIGIFCIPDTRKNIGQHLTIKRINLSTPTTSSTQTAPNRGSAGADKFTQQSVCTTSTPEKAGNYGQSVDNADGVDEKEPFRERDDWVELAPDEELPF